MKKLNNKGITLIALVITVIVLLILTGVTIALITGENGILKRAKKSTSDYNVVAEEEKDKLDTYNKFLAAGGGDVGGSGTPSDSEKAELGWDFSKVTPIYDTNSKDYIVPVPKGFYYVGGNKSTGIVISDNISDIDKGDSHNIAQQLKGNQFVWIPVDNINDLYVKSGGQNRGKLYNFHSGGGSSYSSSTGAMIEPNYVTYTDGTGLDAKLANLQQAGSSATTKEQFKTELQTEFDKMISSVEKYKGFYVGRYETGDLNQSTIVVKANNTNISNGNWYTKYKLQKDLYKERESVNSGMIWGSQWQAMLRYINKNYSTYGEFVLNTERGNHTGTKVPTGSNESYKTNNIYDISGNAAEDTLLAGSGGRKAFSISGQPPSNSLTPTSHYDSSRVSMYIAE